MRGMPLVSFSAAKSAVDDLTPLAGAPLRSVDVSDTPVASLEPLRRAALTRLILANCAKITELTPLEG